MFETLAKKEELIVAKPICAHCGDQCASQAIAIDKQYFCCEGCKMVFSILTENGLGQFYDLNELAGLSQKNQQEIEYAFLDDPEAISKLIDFADEHKTRIHFYLPQIHCSSCLWLLEHLHRINPHFLSSRVDFLKKEVNITFEHNHITLREVVELLAKIGYPPMIQLNDLDANKHKVVDKSLYYKLGLAGFAFGNIMLLSFPEYLGLDLEQDIGISKFFGYLNILLILPVIFYSGRDYFRSAWQGLKQRHLNIDVPVSLGILALFFRSVFEILTHSGAGYLDSLAGLVFFLLIGRWFQHNTYAKISFDRDYKSYFPIAAKVIKQNIEQQVTLDKLEKGDLLVIRHGELIPTDGILMSAKAQIDYSFVSGEAALIERQKGDKLFAGGRQMGGLIQVVVERKVSNSYLTQLWNEHTFDPSQKKVSVSKLADKVAAFFTWTILLVAFFTLIYWLPKDIGIAVNAFTAVLIVACPCAVALSIPFTFGNVLRLLARHHIYLKNIHVIESMASINHIVFDKTGTITSTTEGPLEYKGEWLSERKEIWIRSLTDQSTHPISQKLTQKYKHLAPLPVLDFKEEKGRGVSGSIDQHEIRIGSLNFLNITSSQMMEDDKRTVYFCVDGHVKGSFLLENGYRERLKYVLEALKSRMGISLLSGDNDREKHYLTDFFGGPDQLHFSKTPLEKLNFIKDLQSHGEKVAMIGDGLNDAGALSQSDVGIVVTENTSNFTPASDVILKALMFSQIPTLFSIARQSIRLVYLAYGIALLYNIVGLSFAVRGDLSPVIAAILMPLSSITIVLFGVGMSSILVNKRRLFEKIKMDDKDHLQM